MHELALFAGAGGGILGGMLNGWRTVAAVELDPYCASVLAARQNDGFLAPFPIWDDVRTFDGRPWRGIVDVVSGGFPCQDISLAGSGVGIDGPRSSLWREFARIVGEVRPGFVYLENSAILLVRGFGRVLADLAALGYCCRWCVLGACDVGAPHERERLWLVASLPDAGREGSSERLEVAGRANPQCRCFASRDWWSIEPDMVRVAHGVAARVDRIKALGNGQVPACAAEAWRRLTVDLDAPG